MAFSSRSKQESDEKSYKILDANILRQMPTFLQKLRARSTCPYELTILDFRLYLEGRLSADPRIDPTGDGDDIVNMKPRLSTAWRHHSAEGF